MSGSEEDKKQVNPPHQDKGSGNDTDFEHDVEEEVKLTPKKEEEKKEVTPKHFEMDDDIPVIQVVNPEADLDHDDDDDEDHQYWDSNEDEEAYQKDEFENEEEEEKVEKEKGKSSDYEEDFESEEETEATDKSQVSASHDSREAILKKMEKAKKEKAAVETLLKDRSFVCIKQIGQETFQEIMDFLKVKIGVWKENLNFFSSSSS